MARGRKTSLTIHLTPAERRTLLAWQRATTIPAGLARRGRIILLLSDGMTKRMERSMAQELPGHYPLGTAPVGLWEVP